MPKKNNPGCNCCGCSIFRDTFDRGSGTSLGSSWTETNWSISANKASTSSSNATCFLSSGFELAGMIFLTFRGDDYGDEIKLYLRYTDANNHTYMLYKLAPSLNGSATIKIYEVIAGSSTQKGSTTTLIAGRGEPDVDHYLAFCRYGSATTAVEIDAQLYALGQYGGQKLTVPNMNDTTLTGVGAGFGSGSITSNITVDDFNAVVFEEGVCPFCNSCVLWYDEFDRDDTSGIGSDWVEDTPTYGDFEISGDYLVLPSGGAGDYLLTNGTWSGIGIRTTSLVKATASGDEIGLIYQYIAGTPYPRVLGVMLKVDSTAGEATAWLFEQQTTGTMLESKHIKCNAKPNVWHRLEVCTNPSTGYPQMRVNGEYLGGWTGIGSLSSVKKGVYAGSHTGDLYWDDFRIESVGTLCECEPCIRILNADAPIAWSDDFDKLTLVWDPWNFNNFNSTNNAFAWDWDSSTGQAVAIGDYTSGYWGGTSFGYLLRCLATSPRDLTNQPVGARWSVQCTLANYTLPAYTVGGAYYVQVHSGVTMFARSDTWLEFGPFCNQSTAWEYRLLKTGFALATGLGTPAASDVLKLVVERTGTNTCSAECYVNGSLVHTETGIDFRVSIFGQMGVQSVGLWTVIGVNIVSGSGQARLWWDDFQFELVP